MRISLVAFACFAFAHSGQAQQAPAKLPVSEVANSDNSIASLQADSAAGRRAKWISQTVTIVPLLLAYSTDGGQSADMSPMAMVAGLSLYFGPGAGYWTEGMNGRAWKGVGIRFGIITATMMTANAIMPKEETHSQQEFDAQMNSGSMRTATFVMIGGLAGFITSMVKDITGVEHAVIEHRAQERAKLASNARPSSNFAIAPTMNVQQKSAGLSATWTF